MRQRYCKSFGNFAQLNRIRTRSFKLYWLYVVKNSDLWAYGVLLWILSDCNALSCVNLYIQFIICHNYSFHAVFCVLPVFDFFFNGSTKVREKCRPPRGEWARTSGGHPKNGRVFQIIQLKMERSSWLLPKWKIVKVGHGGSGHSLRSRRVFWWIYLMVCRCLQTGCIASAMHKRS